MRVLDPATSEQLDAVVALVRRVLADAAVGAYLFGSATAGGLRADSDLDVLVVTSRPASSAEREALIAGLLPLSGRRAAAGPARSIELTVVVEGNIRPWRYPPRIDLQYGDWWRTEYESGDLAPWSNPSPDLAILLATARRSSDARFGPPLDSLTDPVPAADLRRAMLDATPDLMADLETDTRNVLLTLARMWATVETGEILPKDEAADFAIPRLEPEFEPVLAQARDAYRGIGREDWQGVRDLVRRCAVRLVAEARTASETATIPG